MLLAFVHQAVVDFIGDDIWALLTLGQGGDLLHAVGRQQIARGIGRGVNKNAPGFGAQFFFDGFGAVLKAVFFINRNGDRPALDKFNEIGIAGIMGIRDDDFIPGLQQC